MAETKNIFKKALWIVVGVLVAVILFLYYANFSDGYRAGVPIKVSHKGKIIKTYEGELNEGGLTSNAEGVLPAKWQFSIRSSHKEVREQLEEAIEKNKRVKVYYHEKYVRFFWLGDTKYFVYKVQILED
ncbi:MAG: 6-phosphogluconate dehydrogenase [Schleiferiaceae bacterium]|jgi:hypothetical protein|nr:6-phosphogluconate dehydrogenase [Schleiferiaceae bacterium]